MTCYNVYGCIPWNPSPLKSSSPNAMSGESMILTCVFPTRCDRDLSSSWGQTSGSLPLRPNRSCSTFGISSHLKNNTLKHLPKIRMPINRLEQFFKTRVPGDAFITTINPFGFTILVSSTTIQQTRRWCEGASYLRAGLSGKSGF